MFSLPRAVSALSCAACKAVVCGLGGGFAIHWSLGLLAVLGVFCTVRQFYPLLRRGGVVVPILSEIAYAYNSSAFNGPYAMTKFALEVIDRFQL